jgi:hypothetical protein
LANVEYLRREQKVTVAVVRVDGDGDRLPTARKDH